MNKWFRRRKLEIATEKTEANLLTGMRVEKISDLQIMGNTVTTAVAICYLGVTLDNYRKFRPHLEKVAARIDKVVGALAAPLPNTRGPSHYNRSLYYNVWELVLLYAAPVWAPSLRLEANRRIIRRAHRTAFIRTSTAYRTVSYQALCMLTGRMPIHLKAGMWWAVFMVWAEDRSNPELTNSPEVIKQRRLE